MMFHEFCRLWLCFKQPDDTSPPQQLGYVNVMPKASYEKMTMFRSIRLGGFGGIMGMGMKMGQMATVEYPVFENLGKTIERFNEMLQEYPLPGEERSYNIM